MFDLSFRLAETAARPFFFFSSSKSTSTFHSSFVRTLRLMLIIAFIIYDSYTVISSLVDGNNYIRYSMVSVSVSE